ncbi:MAG TPA: S1 RNA-binding domain-containing protein [Candidatus Sulfomarinibacteraceae bacterium]|nr:S1 RNA-binding domain-containing protein [Candidatus Sulfomarinibacteraceae bacterium]
MTSSTQVKAVTPSDQDELLAEDEVDIVAQEAQEVAPGVVGDRAATDGTHRSMEAAWRKAASLFEADEVVSAPATGFNKGGLLVEWCGLQGFVPASQLLGLRQLHVEEERLRQLQARQHETLVLKIIEVDRSANRLIFSERASEVPASTRESLLQDLAAGDVRSGVVTNLADFGAFVDLGGVEGLIHISQLSWRRLTHPSDVVRPGQTVHVLVLEVDAEQGRVALSRKQLQTDPWINVEERYRPGQIIEGRVTNVVDFGAFVLLEEGLEGLIHVSEMADAPPEHPTMVLSKGDSVRVRVLHVSEQERRLALSLRNVSPA